MKYHIKIFMTKKFLQQQNYNHSFSQTSHYITFKLVVFLIKCVCYLKSFRGGHVLLPFSLSPELAHEISFFLGNVMNAFFVRGSLG